MRALKHESLRALSESVALTIDAVSAATAIVPRTIGAMTLKSKARDGLTVLDDFRCSGAMRALFPRSTGPLEAIMINTSGGLTSGDRLDVRATAGTGSHLTLTTQAAERAYRAEGDVARVQTHLRVDDDATLQWLPQEMILFDHCGLSRDLRIDLARTGRLLMVEPVIFGRSAMGETVQAGRFKDHISIYRDDVPLYFDRVNLAGKIATQLSPAAVADGAIAMTSVLYVAPDAETHLGPLRATLPQTAGASMLADDVLVVRMVAADSFALRQGLVPILNRLSRNTLPKSWRL